MDALVIHLRSCVVKTELLYRITLNYLCAGVVTDTAGMIIRAAPILNWSAGKHISRLQEWVLQQHGTIQNVNYGGVTE